ncbi:hypothetical protein [Chryseobacterium sp. EO14]|uniref:hypothetical protein n=1 Tax=Chryseobacterium sp. EO14 TaxID=2950551 RepID=UPI00210D4516|nr:hypothetical protein [Chryseobacterium sp. EO14]MCQ4138704.1 hypothetical protein [Chryseobacterium sp. EO14]
MHTTKPIQRYKIFSVKDFTEAVFDENASIEIYAKNTAFDCTEIKGNLVLRGEGCNFPNLENVKGNLSIDAPDCSFPELKMVEENFTMHCPAMLDQLEKVRGNFKCIVDFSFTNLAAIGGSIELKNAAVYAKSKKLVQGRVVIPINHQYEVKNLPKDGIFNIDIFGDHIMIPHQEIRGRINIFGKDISFPNLEFVHGGLKIEITDSLADECTHDFPVLKKMTGNLRFVRAKLSFPELQEMTGTIHLENGSYVNFSALEISGGIMINHRSGASFPVLKEINGALKNHGSETCYLNALEKIKNTFCTYQVFAPNIVEIGGDLDIHTYTHNKFDHLKKVSGRILGSSKVQLKSLEYVGILDNASLAGSEFPSLKEVTHYFYGTHTGLENVAKNIYFRVTDSLCITKDQFIVGRSNFTFVLNLQRHYFKKLISILKLRHSSFQNFKTREFEREWTHYNTPVFNDVLNRIEKLWDKVEPIGFDEFFNDKDRNFKLFCFSYFGVGNLMKNLKAEKINQAEIEVNYFGYDDNGNEYITKKINQYEVHQVENEKLGIFVWGSANRYSYAVKCWCPSTEKEHWLWIEEAYKDNALTAIASTFRIHENIIPHIRCLKRQGDLLICELNKKIPPRGAVRALTASEYFGLLEAET